MKHIFITGCPRSGTTMLASMLGTCESCCATPESDFFLDFIYNRLKNPTNSVSRNELLRFLEKNYRFKQWQVDIDELNELPEFITLSNFNLVIETIVKLYTGTRFKKVQGEFIRIDHTPSTIKNFDIQNNLFPNSKFVFIIRDPRAVFASVKSLDWGANTALKLSDVWIEYVATLHALNEIYPERVYVIKYEEIVLDPTLHLKKLCSFLELKYHDAIINGGGFILPKYTTSQHKLVGSNPVKDRIDKWKDLLSSEEIRMIEAKCGLIMKAFGYNRSSFEFYNVTATDRLNSFLKESYSYFLNKYKKNKRANS